MAVGFALIPLHHDADETSSTHLRTHIRPYFCFIEDCPDEYTSYSNKEHWLEHVETHSLSWKLDEIERHTRDVSAIDPSRFTTLTQMARFWTRRTFHPCPFCHYEPPSGTGSTSHTEDALSAHVANHCDALSLAMLPLEDLEGSNDNIDASNSGAADVYGRMLEEEVLPEDVDLDFSDLAEKAERSYKEDSTEKKSPGDKQLEWVSWDYVPFYFANRHGPIPSPNDDPILNYFIRYQALPGKRHEFRFELFTNMFRTRWHSFNVDQYSEPKQSQTQSLTGRRSQRHRFFILKPHSA